MQLPNFQEMEQTILKEVTGITKALIATLKFNLIYSRGISEKQEKKTAIAVKEYREEYWNKALEKAKGNINLAYRYYTQNLKQLF